MEAECTFPTNIAALTAILNITAQIDVDAVALRLVANTTTFSIAAYRMFCTFKITPTAVNRVNRRMYRFVMTNKRRILSIDTFAVNTFAAVGTYIAALTTVITIRRQIDNHAIASCRILDTCIVFDVIAFPAGCNHTRALTANTILPLRHLTAAIGIVTTAMLDGVGFASVTMEMIANRTLKGIARPIRTIAIQPTGHHLTAIDIFTGVYINWLAFPIRFTPDVVLLLQNLSLWAISIRVKVVLVVASKYHKRE